MSAHDSTIHHRFSSRLGLLLSALGVAVGTGNIWRFPRIAAQNGGETGAGAFLVAWIVFLFVWSIPLIVAEYAMGRKARSAPAGVFAQMAGSRFAWMGGFVTVVASAIAFYYSVVVGWCIFYLTRMVLSPLPASTAAATAVWDQFQGSPWPVFFHALALSLGALAIWKGVQSIERINKLFMPALLLIVAGSVLRALTLPGAWEGVAYLFRPEWGQLGAPRIWLEALTQNAWDTGAGWGLFLVYAAYMNQDEPVVKNAVLTAGGNNLVSLLAGTMIFGTAFAVLRHELAMSHGDVLQVLRESGPASTGLTLIWMPQLFARMYLGAPISVLFFLALSLAGFTSLMAMLELQTRTLVDLGMRRPGAILTVAVTDFLCGLPSAVNLTVFANQDFVWGLALLLCGAFAAFAAARYGPRRLREEEILANPADYRLGAGWDLLIRRVIPVAAALLLVWWLFLSATAYAPESWFNPFDPFSVATCFVQWGLVLGVLIVTNRRLAASHKSDSGSEPIALLRHDP